MMIRRTSVVIFILVFVELVNAQNPYFFKNIKTWINSPISFSNPNYEGLKLETNGLKVQFSKISGMEGIDGLEGSLDSYAKTFGFQSVGKAIPLKLKNLRAARIDANNSGQDIVLVMFANNNFKQHFICEIEYMPHYRNEVEAIVQSIFYDDTQENITLNITSNNTEKKSIENQNNEITSPIKNTHLNGKPLEKITWQLLSSYSPNGYIILDDYLKAPSEYDGTTTSGDCDFTVWIEGTEQKDIVNSANTVVHEMCHSYTGKLYLKLLKDEGKSVDNGSYSAFYVGNHEAILVKHTDVYETKEINSIFPENLKTSRYATYVYPSEKIMGSQQSGCYGLLDELNAYYWGTRTSYDFYNYFKNKNNTPQGWSNFFSDFYGTSYAYLEFKSYILYYLIYAKDNHKDIYDGIIANKDFLEAFQKVDDNWAKLITDFKTLRQNFITEQKRNGMEIREDGGFLYLGTNGTGNFSEIYNLFRNELMDEKFQTVTNDLGLRSSSAPELFNQP